MSSSLSGVFPAVITPFVKGKLATSAYEKHLHFLKEAGVSGVVVGGTTGEGLTLTPDERTHLCSVARDVFGDAPVFMGINAAHLEEAFMQIQSARMGGATGLLVSPPYYVKPDLQGLQNYFENIHNESDFLILLYNNPGRLGFELSLSLLGNLAHLPRVVGLKESSPSLERILTLKNITSWSLLSGNDGTWTAFLAMGGQGVISVGAGIAPELYVRHWQAWQNQDLATVQKLQEPLEKLHRALGLHPNPQAINYMCALKGWGDGSTRLPFSALKAAEKDALSNCMKQLELV